MPSDLRRVRTLVGGRWAVSLPGYLILAPLGVVWMFTTVPEAFVGQSYWVAGAFVAVSSYVVTGLVLWAADVTVLRHRREHPAPMWLVALVGAAAWGARSAYLAGFLAVTGLPSDAGPHVRIATGALLGVIIVPGSAWVLASIAAFRTRRAQLVDELVAKELKAEHSIAYLEAMRSTIVDQVRMDIHSRFERATMPKPGNSMAAALDALAAHTARDLPRQLWTEARRQTTLRATDVLAMAYRRPLSGWPIVPVGVFGVLLLSRVQPTYTSVLLMLGPIGWGALIACGVNTAARQPRLRGMVLYVAGCLLMAGSGLVTALAAHVLDVSAFNSLAFSITVTVTFVIFTAGAGLARAVNVTESRVLTQLRESISQAEIRTVALDSDEAALRRELATILHGTVGANLTAASLRLKASIDAGESAAAATALHEAQRMVELQLAAVTIERNANIAELIDAIAEAWQGFVEITSDVNVVGKPPGPMAKALDDVLTEGVSNAVRHADADHIHIAISGTAEHLDVTITDDGDYTAPEQPGLGSRILDAAAPDSWSLSSNGPRGARLQCTLTSPRA